MEKILSFIVNNNKELLLLHGNNNDPQFHESFWYVITGSREIEDNDLIDTVKREVKEETNLNVTKIIDLNWIFKYESLGEQCIEHAFLTYIEVGEIILNEENFEYEWCTLDKFIKKIKWFYDKEELIRRIQKYFIEK